jgi:hypothetical protein
MSVRLRPHHLALITSAIALCLGCDSPTDQSGCLPASVNSNLTRVLYWGEVESDLGSTHANAGYPVDDVLLPRWIQDDRILIFGNVIHNEKLERGIFQLDVDPVTFRLQDITRYVYNGVIWIRAYDWLSESSEVVLEYSVSSQHVAVAKGRLENGALNLGPELAGVDWQPSGVSHWPGHQGFVFYGRDPATTKPGFFWLRDDDAVPDSLLLELPATVDDTMTFDFSPDGSVLYTATSSEDYPQTCRLFAYDLASGVGIVIFEGRGSFYSLDAHATQNRVLLNRWYFGAAHTWPGEYVNVIDRDTGRQSLVDVRTHAYDCSFIVAHDVTWRPDGGAFAFLGGWFSGEGDYAPLELWVRKVAP